MHKLLTLLSVTFAIISTQYVNAQVIMSNGSVTACGGTFMDPGGAGNYSNGATLTMTINPSNAGDGVCLDFSVWDLDYSVFGWSELSFYNGTSTSDPLIMTATGDWATNPSGSDFDFVGPGMVCATGPMTIEWNPDDNGVGWEAAISCFTPSAPPGCNISVNANPTNICTGDTVNLSAIGDIIDVPLSNDFNASSIGTGWSSTVNARFDNPCGPGLDGTPHLWMGVEPAPRTLQSNTYDVSNGGTISFDFKMATQAAASPCEGPDEDDEGVYLQYSTNGGTNWNTIHYFYPPHYTDGSQHALSWQNYQFNIPPAAQTTATMFRWIQNEISSASTDHWGMDNVVISFPTTSTISFDQGLGVGDNFTVSPVATTTYTATITNGTTSCDAQVTVNVAPCGCPSDVGTMNVSTTGNSTNTGVGANEYILCDGDHFIIDSNNDFVNSPGANPALDYAIYTCAPTAGVEPLLDPCFSSSYIETPPDVDEINNGGINSNIITYLNGTGQNVNNNTVWIVPITLSVSALNANVYDPACYDLGTPYQVTYLNPITTSDLVDCPNGTVDVTISGGYPEFFVGNYNIVNTGAGTLSSTTLSASGGTITISGMTSGDSYSLTITDDNGCPVTYAGGTLNCGCSASVGNVNVTGATSVGTNHYELTNCNTINFSASGEDLDGGNLTYGWAVFTCQPALPFTASEIADFNNHPCYVGQATGTTASDIDAAGISGTIPGGHTSLWILPYTSETLSSGSLDIDSDGCYDFGDFIQIDYIPPTCGDCSAPACPIGSVNEFADRTYLLCDDPCADLNDVTHVTYHTITTDAFGNVGVVQQLSFDQVGCSALSRTAVLRTVANSCSGPDIAPTTANTNGVGSGFNPEWTGLTPNTNYTLIITTVIGSSCNYDFGCVDFYGIPGCTAVIDNAVTNNPSCLGNDGSIDVQTSGTNGVVNYSINGGTQQTNSLFTGLADGVYLIEIEDANNCTDTLSVALIAPANVSYVSTEVDLTCNNDGTGQITFSNVTGGDGNYSYSIDNGNLFQNSSSFTGLNAGNYDLIVQDGSGCSATSSVFVDEPAALSLNFTKVNVKCSAACDGEANVVVNNGTAPYSYLWTIPGAGNIDNVQNICAGTYDLTVTDSNGCMIDTLAFVINEPPAIIINGITLTDPLCSGDNNGGILIDAVNAVTYSLDGGITNQAPNTFNGLIAGTYAITIKDAGNCELDTVITITDPAPINLNLSLDTTICSGESATLSTNVTGGTPAYTYTWDNGLSNQASHMVSPIANTSYNVFVSDGNGCNSAIEQVNVDIFGNLSVQAFSDTSLCEGESFNLTSIASNGSGTYNYTWESNGTIIGNLSNHLVTPLVTTSYNVFATDACPNNIDSSAVTITVNELPNPLFTVLDSTLCVGSSTTLVNLTDPNFTGNCIWTIEGQDYTGCGTLDYLFNNEGCFDVSLSVTSAEGCEASSTQSSMVCLSSYPNANFNFNPDSLNVLNTNVDFVNTSTDNLVNSWNFDHLGYSSAVDTTFEFPTEAGDYEVCLTVENNFGCNDVDCQVVTIDEALLIYVPNAFSPNGDGINDTFNPIVSGYTDNYEFLIFNRWGEVVFQMNSATEFWDGNQSGNLVKSDVYVWQLKVNDPYSADVITKRGHVIVIR